MSEPEFSAGAADLPSWKDKAAREAIVDFVQRVTTVGGPDYVPPEERVATFDNDGTLWCEKPMYIQLDFILRRMASQAAQDASLRDKQPWKAAFEKDYDWLGAAVTKHYQGDDSDLHIMLGGVLKSYEGISAEDNEAEASTFLHSERHPTLDRPYLECAYRPMIELLRYLEANDFSNYIVTGGGQVFVRAISEELYGIPVDRVVGSTTALTYEEDEQGGTVISKAEFDVFDDGPMKVLSIWNRIGRRPILAGGNSDGDIEMLKYVNHPSRPSLSLLVKHDDDDREFAYTAGAEKSLDLAKEKGWIVISIKNDWIDVFPTE